VAAEARLGSVVSRANCNGRGDHLVIVLGETVARRQMPFRHAVPSIMHGSIISPRRLRLSARQSLLIGLAMLNRALNNQNNQQEC
jgi:hypothetical protein